MNLIILACLYVNILTAHVSLWCLSMIKCHQRECVNPGLYWRRLVFKKEKRRMYLSSCLPRIRLFPTWLTEVWREEEDSFQIKLPSVHFRVQRSSCIILKHNCMSVIFCSLRSAHSRLPVWLVPSPSDSVFSISLLTRPDHCSSSAFGFFLLGLPARFFFFHWSASLFTFSLRRAWVIPRQVLQMESTSLS